MRRPLPEALVTLGFGAAWIARGIQSFWDPNFSDPETAADWMAVILVTVGLVGVLPAVNVLTSGIRRSALTWGAVGLAGLGGVTAGVANLAEDGAGVEAAGGLYLIGTLAVILGLFGLAILLMRRSEWVLGGVALVTVIGLLNLESFGSALFVPWLAVPWISPAKRRDPRAIQ